MNDKLTRAAELLDNPIISRGATAIVLVAVLWVGFRILKRAVASRIEDPQLRYKAKKTVSAIGWVAILVACASIFSDKLGGLAISLGVAGAGIAFALQEVIASVAGRIAIMFASFYEPGDRVQLGGIKGDVIDIGLLRTTIMEVGAWVKGDLFTGRVVRVANSFIFKEPVFNYSGDFGFLWDEITVPVKYGCSHRYAREVLETIADDVTGDFAEQAGKEWDKMLDKYRVEAAQVDPMVTLIANDNWMEFTIRYVVPFTRRRGTKDKMFTRIMDAVDESGGKLALASATFHLVEAPPIEFRLAEPVPPVRAIGA
ncbi:MAG: mechanosensitive ion channel family protein [Polyangiaceae bacterium]